MSDGIDTLGRGLESILDAVSGGPLFEISVFLLAFVFLASAVPKLRRPELTALAMVDFGVAKQVRRAAGLSVGLGQLLLAISLGVAAVTTVATVRAVPLIVAAAVLWMFVVLIARALRAPERFSCSCFGGDETPISRLTLLRTGGLAAAATILGAAAFAPVSETSLQVAMLDLIVAASSLGSLLILVRIPTIWSAFR